MKYLNRIGGVILTAALVLTTALPAMAADAAIDTDRDGNSTITIYKYAVDDTSGLTLEADGEKLEDDPVIDEDGTKLSELTPLDGVGFKLTLVEDDAEDPATAVPVAAPDDYTDTQYTVGGQLTFTDLAFGVYLIEELPSGTVDTPVEPFLVRLPMTNPTGDGWIYDVHVYPKNVLASSEGPEIDKDVTTLGNKHETVGLGESATWIISAEVPEDIGNAGKYVVTDTLDTRLAYDANTLEVYYLDATGTPVYLTAGTDYTFDEAEAVGNGQLTVTLLPAGQTALDEGLSFDNVDTEGLPKLYISFDTTLTDPDGDIDTWLGTEIVNGAELEYENSWGVEYESQVAEKDRPEVHTGGVRIIKLDSDAYKQNETQPLSGAVFRIYETEADAKAGTNPISAPGSTDPWEATTGADGYAYFYSLGYGTTGDGVNDTETEYWIAEVQAPTYVDDNGATKSYNLLDAPVKVTVSATSHLVENQVTVLNSKGFTLPLTGGTGTMLFTAAGVALVGAAAIAFFATRKKRED